MSNPSYQLTELDGGLRVATAPMPHMASVAVGIWVGVGGRYEPAPLSGIAHFIEHMLFKGTTRRSAREISEAVEGIGGSEVPDNLHREVLDGAERVSDAESFAMVQRLVREEGLLVGGSAGTNVVAAIRLAARGDLDGPVVTVLPDSWDRYRAKPWMQGW